MCKASRNQELLLILLRQLNAVPFAVGFAARTQVNCHIEYRPFNHSHQLGLRKVFLEVQSAEHTFHTHGLIVLNKIDVDPVLLHISLAIGFHKIATSITVDSRRDHTQSLDAAYILFYIYMSHCFISSYRCASFKYRLTASCQVGSGWKPVSTSLLLSSRLLNGRAALLRPYSTVVTGVTFVFKPYCL